MECSCNETVSFLQSFTQFKTAPNFTRVGRNPAECTMSTFPVWETFQSTVIKSLPVEGGQSSRRGSMAPSTSIVSGLSTKEASGAYPASFGWVWIRFIAWLIRGTTNCVWCWKISMTRRLTPSTTFLHWQMRAPTTLWSWAFIQVNRNDVSHTTSSSSSSCR